MKHVTQSKTVWGVAVMLLAYAVRALWPDQATEIMEIIGTFAGAALAVYGRFQAKEDLNL